VLAGVAHEDVLCLFGQRGSSGGGAQEMVPKNWVRSCQYIEHSSTESASACFVMVVKVSMTER
jgi:hypothetical protein